VVVDYLVWTVVFVMMRQWREAAWLAKMSRWCYFGSELGLALEIVGVLWEPLVLQQSLR
jgi:hypothetical protein